MQQPSDEIKSRLDIVEVIREYIQLKPAGLNFSARCPFHNEKTPSFMVSPEKQIWHCFGCQKGGDLFTFVMEMEGLSFVEALRLLAPKAGVTLRRTDPKLTSQRNRLLDIVELSAKFYHQLLLNSEPAGTARQYLAQRGLKEETIIEWRLGYSPDSWDELLKFLKSQGYSENEIFLAGMIVKKEIGGNFSARANNNRAGFYDRFRGRIMFPLNDLNGSAVGFSARQLPAREAVEKMGKYINSPQTMIYDKSKIIFGLDKAKLAIKQEELAVMVEGQMDAITAHQHGFKNVVASSGTALTAEQVALLKRYSQNLALAFDSDQAGQLAVSRGIDQALKAEINLKVIELKQGKDPDEAIRRNPRDWQQAVAQAKPVMQYYFARTLKDLSMADSQDRRQAVKVLLPVVAKLGNRIEQEFWLKKLSQTVEVGEIILRESLAGLSSSQEAAETGPVKTPEIQSFNRSREEILSELLLALLLKHQPQIEYVIAQLQPEQIVGRPNQVLYRNLIIYYNKFIDASNQDDNFIQSADQDLPADDHSRPLINYQSFKNWLADQEAKADPAGYEQARHQENSSFSQPKLLDRLALLADKDFYDYSPDQIKTEIIKIIRALKKYYLLNRLKELARLIARAEQEADQDQEKLNNLMEEFKILTGEIREFDGSG